MTTTTATMTQIEINNCIVNILNVTSKGGWQAIITSDNASVAISFVFETENEALIAGFTLANLI